MGQAPRGSEPAPFFNCLLARRQIVAGAKKGPRKGRVPGGQRTATLSGSDWTVGVAAHLLLKCVRQEPRRVVCEAYRRHPCQRNSLRGPQDRRCRLSRCRPTHMDSLFLFCSRADSRFPVISRLGRPFDFVRREDMRIEKSGQGGFFAVFSACFYGFSNVPPAVRGGWALSRTGLRMRVVCFVCRAQKNPAGFFVRRGLRSAARFREIESRVI